ncbi:MAG TPA: hypothetical protein VIJ38_07395 [Acidobacteriaceae bacterium]
MKPLCIYHGKCADGFTSAWAVWRHNPDTEFHAGVYGEAPPDVTDRHVILVDFSYKRPVLEAMAEKAVTVLILDHHKTAQEDLAPFINYNLHDDRDYHPIHRGSIQALFDMDRSGAGITWDFFHPGTPRPALVNYVEDRDLWRFKLENSREVNAAVFSYEYTFENWDYLARMADLGSASALADAGRAIERKHHKDVVELVEVCRRRMKIGGIEVWGASIPYTLTSDAGNLMSEGELFAVCYWDTPKGRVFSLRSKPEGADVSAIAKAYGGGGHKNASGFTVPLAECSQFELGN